MKKKFLLFMGVIALICGCFVSSCGDDKDSLSGVYGCDMQEGYGECYDFINDNTVIFYPDTHKGKYIGNHGELSFTDRIGKSDWYNCEEGRSASYTYVFENNTLVIPMQGRVFSYSGGELRRDGSSLVYKK